MVTAPVYEAIREIRLGGNATRGVAVLAGYERIPVWHRRARRYRVFDREPDGVGVGVGRQRRVRDRISAAVARMLNQAVMGRSVDELQRRVEGLADGAL